MSDGRTLQKLSVLCVLLSVFKRKTHGKILVVITTCWVFVARNAARTFVFEKEHTLCGSERAKRIEKKKVEPFADHHASFLCSCLR